MDNSSYSYRFTSAKSAKEIYNVLLQIDKWWLGIYGEQISGGGQKLDDEFRYTAGNGVHYSKQKLVELVPEKKITWQVAESHLSFLQDKNEWTGTKIGFEIMPTANVTEVIFSHEGLTRQLECYNACSGAWTQYMERLKEKLQ